MGRVEQKLRDDGFAVVGRHLPPGLPQHGSVIVTDPALNQAARKAGGTAVLATALRIGVKSDGSVSHMNPRLLGPRLSARRLRRRRAGVALGARASPTRSAKARLSAATCPRPICPATAT